MAKYAGIKFRMNDETYVANITIIDTTTSSDVIRDKQFDTFYKAADYTTGAYVIGTFWWKLPYDDHEYEILVSNGGAVAGRTTYGNYPSQAGEILIEGYLMNSPLNPGTIYSVLSLWHTDFPLDIINVNIESYDLRQSLLQTASFDGDAVETEFAISGTKHARQFYRWSIDGGTTWYYPSDADITWGSNSPDFDDETIDEDGYFTVKFLDAPPVGTNNVKIQWYPMLNRGKIVKTMKFPNDGASYVDVRGELRLLDYSIEFIP